MCNYDAYIKIIMHLEEYSNLIVCFGFFLPIVPVVLINVNFYVKNRWICFKDMIRVILIM